MHLYVCHFCGVEHSDKYGHAAVCAPNPTIASILRQRSKEMPRDVRVAAVEALIAGNLFLDTLTNAQRSSKAGKRFELSLEGFRKAIAQ